MLYRVIIVCLSLWIFAFEVNPFFSFFLFLFLTTSSETSICFTFLGESTGFCWVSWTQQKTTMCNFFFRNFLHGEIKNMCQSAWAEEQVKTLAQKDSSVKSQPRDKWSAPWILTGKAWQNQWARSPFFHLWLAHSCSSLRENLACLPGTDSQLSTS